MAKAEIAKIKKMFKDTQKLWQQGDAERLASYYTTDCVQMPVGEKEIKGRKAWTRELQKMFKKYAMTGTSRITEIVVGKKLAFLRGPYKIILTPKKAGKKIIYTGKFLHILKKQKESWKIFRATGADD